MPTVIPMMVLVLVLKTLPALVDGLGGGVEEGREGRVGLGGEGDEEEGGILPIVQVRRMM